MVFDTLVKVAAF